MAAVIVGFGINTDFVMDSDIGLYSDKVIETDAATRMEMKQLLEAVGPE
jgi:hypothetical protein